jgi:hypothetical protein
LSEIVNAIGELHLNKLIINAQLKQLDAEISQQESKFEEFQNNERVLYETLQQKYGIGTINLETGEITE